MSQDKVCLTPSSVTKKPKSICIDQCILCQKKKASEYLSSGETGRNVIVSLAHQAGCSDIRAKRVLRLTADELVAMKYHSSSCYRNFQRDQSRTTPQTQVVTTSEAESSGDTSERRSKRLKLTVSNYVCVFCSAECKTVNFKKIRTLYRVCEKTKARQLLNAAMLFKDCVYTKTATLQGVDDVFAADIRYHGYCSRNYFNRYNAKITEILNNLEMEDSVTAENDSIKARFVALGLDFTSSAHSLSSIRDRLNEGATDPVSNRVVKNLIIAMYGDSVCFTYPKNKRLSQMVLAVNSPPEVLVESLRLPPSQQVASDLAQEMRNYDFGLQTSFHEPNDIRLSSEKFSDNRPQKWDQFCSQLFKGKTGYQQKTDVVFQIMFYILTEGKQSTPFHIMVAQAVHSLTRSKELVTALNHHGICVSYNTVKRIDVDLAERIITTAGDSRVPLPDVIEATSPLNGSMDNFDRNESTLSGTGSTHDTILVLFQNVPIQLQKPAGDSSISVRPPESRTTVKLRSKVGCQELIRMGQVNARGEILNDTKGSNEISQSNEVECVAHEPGLNLISDVAQSSATFSPSMDTASFSKSEEISAIIENSANDTKREPLLIRNGHSINATKEAINTINLAHFMWIVKRLLSRDQDGLNTVPSFTAVRSEEVGCNFHPTTKILTPILPYPATTYDAIFTTMKNFQDALRQKGDAYGGLWADEGVYRIAKEIQLIKPDQFSNIFLGLGGFHMEKIVLACLGTYLEPSGIFGVLVETECFGTDVIKGVISASHYDRAREAHSNIYECLMSIMLKSFISDNPAKQCDLEAMQLEDQFGDSIDINMKERAKIFRGEFEVYLEENASKSQSFAYWKLYVSDLFPIIRDLTNSMRSGDWLLYISAMERATSLFFFFGRTNYCRWTPLFLQDCYNLQDKFPKLHSSYIKGGFVVNTNKKGSGVPFDQALEQCYNRPAKVSGGIIGVTRKKEAVALWGIIKHKKDQYVDLLKMNNDFDGEFDLHHDFNPSSAAKTVKMVQDIEEYLLKTCSPLQDHCSLKNVLTGEIVTNCNVEKLLCCIKDGNTVCEKYIDDRLKKKTVSIHSTITKIKFTTPNTKLNTASKADIKDETIKALMFLEYGCHRGFTVQELLQHEITNLAFFLVYEDGYLRKSKKSQLGVELLKLCPNIDTKGPETPPPANAIIIDFMALVRKLPLKKLHPPVKTFNDFAVALTGMITKAGDNCEEIHVVFDGYKEDSIKNRERERRGKSKDMIVFDKISPNQNVPVALDQFWSSSVSKTAFQAFYVNWLTINYKGTKHLYLGITPHTLVVSAGNASPVPALSCSHEEADDRMMFHINYILTHRTEPTSLTLLSGDTDVFVCLLYHITMNWKDLGLRELWLIRNSGLKRSVLPLHDICKDLGMEITKCLPALHALTGCDTTSKISTKLSALNAVRKSRNCDLIINFGSYPLTESAMQMAETFLVKCLKPLSELETFDELRLDAFDSSALKMDFEKTPCTSLNIRKHILRCFYQLLLWIRAPFNDASLTLELEEYGFLRSGHVVVPEIIISKPDGLPDPCTCGKCARQNVCPCRKAEIHCCKYCKCKGGSDCKNPISNTRP